MNEPIPDRCDDCGGLRKPARHEQAICRCGKRTYGNRFYGPAPKDEAHDVEAPAAMQRAS